VNFAQIGHIARHGRRGQALGRPAPPRVGATGSIRGSSGVRRWWFTASRRHRTSVVATCAAATFVGSVLVSQAVTPFWWTSTSVGHLTASVAAAPESALAPTADQQSLWGLITGQPGAKPAVAALATSFGASDAVPAPVAAPAAAPAVAAISPATAARPIRATPLAAKVKAHRVVATPVAQAAPVVSPAELAAAKIKLRALEMSSAATSTIVRNLESSGVAKILCTNDPAAVAKWSLQTFCASVAAASVSPQGAP
jgi:hypothetical protein